MLYFALLVASLGGFLFGYQTAIIAGALLFVSKAFSLTTSQEGFLVSILLIGALIGALASGKLADIWGRKLTIALSAFVFVIASVLSAFANSYDFLLFSRFLSGIGVGLCSVVCPMYIAEIAPPDKRGGLVATNQLAITIGILTAYILSYVFSFQGNWRWMFGVGSIPAFIQLIGLFGIKDSVRPEKTSSGSLPLKALAIGIGLSIFQQITGINAVIYFAPKIFQYAGFEGSIAPLYATMGVGIINVFATLVSVWLLDKVGRRVFLMIGSLGMAASLIVLGYAFNTGHTNIDLIAPISLMAYVSFFAMSLGPVVWVVISEIYPLNVRGKAMSIAIFVNWVFNYLVSLTFLGFVKAFSIGTTFFLFSIVCFLSFYFSYKFVPETKGKKLS